MLIAPNWRPPAGRVGGARGFNPARIHAERQFMRAASVTAEIERFTHRDRAAPLPSLAESQAYCRQLAQSHYENFTVASRLLPRALRQHFANVYAYCRWADDLADETGGGQASLDLLAWWEEELLSCYEGTPRHPVMAALSETIRAFEIPPDPFRRLLFAFRQDQRTQRYATTSELSGYCENSANPVGRLVLYLGRCHDELRGALSDAVCTGLQLANFCQDVRRDWEIGRLYLAQELYESCGARREALEQGDFDAAWRQALALHVDWAQRELDRGAALVPLVARELRLDVWLFVAGGNAILRKIRQQRYDVWTMRPKVSKRDQLGLLARGWWLRTTGRLSRQGTPG